MKLIPFKDAFVFHNPGQEELVILGGKTKFNDKELVEVAKSFGIESFKTVFSEVLSAAKDTFGDRKYFCYHLMYGSNSPYWKLG